MDRVHKPEKNCFDDRRDGADMPINHTEDARRELEMKLLHRHH